MIDVKARYHPDEIRIIGPQTPHTTLRETRLCQACLPARQGFGGQVWMPVLRSPAKRDEGWIVKMSWKVVVLGSRVKRKVTLA